MKTPEEIFEQVTADVYTDEDGRDLALVVKAIEADRAQRAADLETLADAAAEWARELTDYVIPEASEYERENVYEPQRDEIQAALGRYLDEKEAVK